MRPRSLATVILAVAGLVMSLGGSASAAAPYLHERFSGPYSFEFDDCGPDLRAEGAFTSVTTIRIVQGSDGQAFFGHDTFKFTETVTLADDDPSTDAFVSIDGRGNFVEQHATHIEGNIWRFEAIEAHMIAVRDSDGNLLLRERGMLQLAASFDLLGDGEPGGEFIEGSEVVVVHGPHSDDFCAIVLAELT